jgi:hypothetical protein
MNEMEIKIEVPPGYLVWYSSRVESRVEARRKYRKQAPDQKCVNYALAVRVESLPLYPAQTHLLGIILSL